MPNESATDAWLSVDDYTARAKTNAGIRGAATQWLAGMLGWFAENRLMTHLSMPVMNGIHWTRGEVWMLVTPLLPDGTPQTTEERTLAMAWAPCPTAPPPVLREIAEKLPAGSAVPGVKPLKVEHKLIRAPSWKEDLRRVNVYLQDRKDWWEHHTLGVDAQRPRNTDGSWHDRINDI